MKNMILAFFALLKCILIKILFCHDFNFTMKNLFLSNVKLDFRKKAHVKIGDLFSCRRNVQISVDNEASLIVGDNVFINTNSVIACHKKISIGDNVKFGPNTMIFDHDHVYNLGKITNTYIMEDIQIGNDVWFGANCIILKGSTIGNNCIFAAGCIVTGDYPDNSFVIQKRETIVKMFDKYNGAM